MLVLYSVTSYSLYAYVKIVVFLFFLRQRSEMPLLCIMYV